MKSKLPRCPVETTMSLIDKKYKPLIWCAIFYGKKRFNEIRKNLGNISTKVLTANLRSMEESGLLTRTVYPEVPHHVEYNLTELGMSLEKVLHSMMDWGCAYKYEQEGIMPILTEDGILLAVSKASKNDLAEILELQRAAYQSEAALLGNYNIPPLKQTAEDLENDLVTSIFLKVIDDRDKIVGSVRGHAVDGSLLIGKLIVHPEMQGKGIGTKLLKEIERTSDCSRFELFTSSKSVRNIELYTRVGYSIFKEESVSDNLKFIYLQKTKSLQSE